MDYMMIQTQKTIHKLKVKDIYYIQTHPTKVHTVQVVTEEGIFALYQSLSSLEDRYGEILMRYHRNCLVNLDKLKSIDLQERILFLGEQDQYPVKYSRRCYREIRQEWLKKGE